MTKMSTCSSGGKLSFIWLVHTYNDVTALVENRWASCVDTANVFLPTSNALSDVLLVTPHSLGIREVNTAY